MKEKNNLAKGAVDTTPKATTKEEECYQLEVKVPDGKGGYTTRVVKIDYKSNVYNKPLLFENFGNFPNVGEKDKLYIALDTYTIYIFEEETMIYKSLTSDWHDIELIDCGGVQGWQR